MSNQLADDVFVLLSDWRGRVVWSSRTGGRLKLGELMWSVLLPESQERVMESHAKVATLRHSVTLLVSGEGGEHLRAWLWPLDTPDVAVCVLCRKVPEELSNLTARENQCLELLAQGLPTREIADRLKISASTLHTHLMRTREKLKIDNIEALISFAARYCYPQSMPLVPKDNTT